ncbi:MAG TPA: hypothetical protein VFS31_11695 [Chitinophagaceae bacterium]|nr:hypothetical protein [Chitinophagaceae bacterium]
MELLKKETGIIELTMKGRRYATDPQVSTDYIYEMIIDPVLNKPAFVLRSETQITFTKEDYILFKSFAVYIFDSANGEYMHENELWKIILDGQGSMNNLLHEKLKPLPGMEQVHLSVLKHQEEQPVLQRLIIAAFRLN